MLPNAQCIFCCSMHDSGLHSMQIVVLCYLMHNVFFVVECTIAKSSINLLAALRKVPVFENFENVGSYWTKVDFTPIARPKSGIRIPKTAGWLNPSVC